MRSNLRTMGCPLKYNFPWPVACSSTLGATLKKMFIWLSEKKNNNVRNLNKTTYTLFIVYDNQQKEFAPRQEHVSGLRLVESNI